MKHKGKIHTWAANIAFVIKSTCSLELTTWNHVSTCIGGSESMLPLPLLLSLTTYLSCDADSRLCASLSAADGSSVPQAPALRYSERGHLLLSLISFRSVENAADELMETMTKMSESRSRFQCILRGEKTSSNALTTHARWWTYTWNIYCVPVCVKARWNGTNMRQNTYTVPW